MFVSFEAFLEEFIPKLAKKEKQLNQLLWVVETTGSKDASDLYADFLTEYKLLFQDSQLFEELLRFEREGRIKDPLLLRQLNLLILSFRSNQIDRGLVEKMSRKEAELSQIYLTFRPVYEGRRLTENEIRLLMTNEKDPSKRKVIWEKSKEIGSLLSPRLLELVALRNQAAHSLGYANYFEMQLALQEVDPEFLFSNFEKLERLSKNAYQSVLDEIEGKLSVDFQVPKSALGPWSWKEPFCQEDPLAEDLDRLVEDQDLLEMAKVFYTRMGSDVSKILQSSDLYEREGKNQHAFCVHIDREGDVRTLNNLKNNMKWAETLLHELGHGIYELGYDTKLPWLLKAPPHMLTTEAIALIVGRQVYIGDFLKEILSVKDEALIKRAERSLYRRQLIFSRWALVMTYFERELYQNPNQDLNQLWWTLVERFQGIKRPSDREGKGDFAAKYHISMAPVYYYSYLLGECLASQLQQEVAAVTGSRLLATKVAGELFQRLFKEGNRYPFDELIQRVVGAPFSVEPWIEEFRGD